MNADINTCLALDPNFSISYYSHLVPLFLILVLSIFLLVRTKFSLFSKIFAFFGTSFCVWLLGDLVTWTQGNYNLVTFSWAPLDYINIIFYLFGAYFFAVFIKQKDIAIWQKIVLFVLSLPGLYITVVGKTIPLFNQPWCEAFNSDFLGNYKLGLEFAIVGFIILAAFTAYHKGNKTRRKQIITVSSALVLFFATFSVTEYVASQTGVYEINLYSLFILPLFLGLIIYSITSLEVVHLRSFGTQLLIYVLLIMVGSQFFFLQNTTDKTLTLITFLLSLAFSFFLMRSTRREAEARKRIEELAYQLEQSNEKLKSLDQLKTEFLSLASHQLRSPLTAIKGYASMLAEGSFGNIDDKPKEAVNRIYASAQGLANIVEDLLNVSKIEQGGMKYEMMPTELAGVVTGLYNEMKIPAQNKNLEFTLTIPPNDKFMAVVDPLKMKQVFLNLTDNSIKYTTTGFVKISLSRDGSKIVFAVADSGIGITPETKKALFEKFSRGEGGKMNTGGSGLGLYLAREIARAHKGDIIIESEGYNKGSTFKVVIPAADPIPTN